MGDTVSAATTRGRWMALTAALLGWLFDGFEIGLFPLVGQPALQELLGSEARPADVSRWFSVILAVFLVGAASGGVLFGWLGDRIGRVRAMALSVLTYAVFTGLCGFATQAWHIAVLRFIASLGMGGEWSLGVALVTEIWPDRSRAFLAGLIGAAANVGFILVGLLSLVLSALSQTGSGWRTLMLAGALPAVLTFFIRLFVPESQRWEQERQRGATSYWATRDLLGVLVGTAGACLIIYVWSPVVTNLAIRLAATALGLGIALVGYVFPVARYLTRSEAAGAVPRGSRVETVRRLFLGAALAGVALLGTWGSIQWAPRWAFQLTEGVGPATAKEWTSIASGFGAVVGTILAALMGDWFGRRPTYVLLCLASLGSALFLFQGTGTYGGRFLLAAFLAGGATASFYGWLPLYLPELFRTAVRATSQGFSYNFGRILAAVGTLQTPTLMEFFDKSFSKAGSVMSLIYVVGVVIIWLGPETRGKPLPE
jgi:MFS transporter, SHS family, sialic acid transporter